MIVQRPMGPNARKAPLLAQIRALPAGFQTLAGRSGGALVDHFVDQTVLDSFGGTADAVEAEIDLHGCCCDASESARKSGFRRRAIAIRDGLTTSFVGDRACPSFCPGLVCQFPDNELAGNPDFESNPQGGCN